MRKKKLTIANLILASALAVSLTPRTHAALTPEQRAQMEESIRQLEEATSNMMAQAEAARAIRPAPTAAQIAAQSQAGLAQIESNRLAVLPYLHNSVKMPDGT